MVGTKVLSESAIVGIREFIYGFRFTRLPWVAFSALLSTIYVVENIFKVHFIYVSLLLHGVTFTLCALRINLIHFGWGITRVTRLYFILLATSLSDTIKVTLISSETKAHFTVILFCHWEPIRILSSLFKPGMLEHLRYRYSISRLNFKHFWDEVLGISRNRYRVANVASQY